MINSNSYYKFNSLQSITLSMFYFLDLYPRLIPINLISVKIVLSCTYVSLLHNKNSDPYDMPPTNRSCGGQHTMTYSHRRTRISALRYYQRVIFFVSATGNTIVATL